MTFYVISICVCRKQLHEQYGYSFLVTNLREPKQRSIQSKHCIDMVCNALGWNRIGLVGMKQKPNLIKCSHYLYDAIKVSRKINVCRWWMSDQQHFNESVLSKKKIEQPLFKANHNRWFDDISLLETHTQWMDRIRVLIECYTSSIEAPFMQNHASNMLLNTCLLVHCESNSKNIRKYLAHAQRQSMGFECKRRRKRRRRQAYFIANIDNISITDGHLWLDHWIIHCSFSLLYYENSLFDASKSQQTFWDALDLNWVFFFVHFCVNLKSDKYLSVK